MSSFHEKKAGGKTHYLLRPWLQLGCNFIHHTMFQGLNIRLYSRGDLDARDEGIFSQNNGGIDKIIGPFCVEGRAEWIAGRNSVLQVGSVPPINSSLKVEYRLATKAKIVSLKARNVVMVLASHTFETLGKVPDLYH